MRRRPRAAVVATDARGAGIEARLVEDRLVIEVRDDGDGGADPARGTGLVGLLDRVEAGNGTLTLSSPAGAGTTSPPGPVTGAPGRAAEDDALDLGATVVPILLRSYGRQVAAGLGVLLLVWWLVSRPRGRR